MKPILEVTYLANNHGSTLQKCSGCKICNRIAEVMKDVDVDPNEKYKWLLDKGEDLTVSEIIYLNGKDVLKSKIQQATGLTKKELSELLLKGEVLDKKSIKAVEEMGAITKFNMTKEKAEQLKAEGKKKSEIAKIAGVSPATYTYHEKKWDSKAESNKVAPLKVKDAAPVRDYAEYTTVINDLKAKLKHSEQVVEQKDKLNKEYADKNMRLSADNVQLSAQNEKLVARIEQLEQEKMDLHAAANDMEKEAASAVEYLERESELMIDADTWKQQALQYKADNQRLNDNLSETRQELAKYKGEYVLVRATLKAVL